MPLSDKSSVQTDQERLDELHGYLVQASKHLQEQGVREDEAVKSVSELELLLPQIQQNPLVFDILKSCLETQDIYKADVLVNMPGIQLLADYEQAEMLYGLLTNIQAPEFTSYVNVLREKIAATMERLLKEDYIEAILSRLKQYKDSTKLVKPIGFIESALNIFKSINDKFTANKIGSVEESLKFFKNNQETKLKDIIEYLNSEIKNNSRGSGGAFPAIILAAMNQAHNRFIREHPAVTTLLEIPLSVYGANLLPKLPLKDVLSLSESSTFFRDATKEVREVAKVAHTHPIIRLIVNPTFDRKKYVELLNNIDARNKTKVLTTVLLHHVAFGQEYMAKKILEENPELLFAKGTVTDYSGRVFIEISPWQLAGWGLDSHMEIMMLKMRTKDKQPVVCQENSDFYMNYEATIEQYLEQIDQDTLVQLHQQRQELEQHPENFSEHGSHYDFKVLESYRAYLALPRYDIDQNEKRWRQLSDDQLNMPVHVGQEYLARGLNYSFMLWRFPNRFMETRLPRYDKDRDNRFFHQNRLDRFAFVYIRAQGKTGRAFDASGNPGSQAVEHDRAFWTGPRESVAIDLPAVTRLCEIRTEESNILTQALAARLQQIPTIKTK